MSWRYADKAAPRVSLTQSAEEGLVVSLARTATSSSSTLPSEPHNKDNNVDTTDAVFNDDEYDFTTKEQLSLISGATVWTLATVPRYAPLRHSIRLADGPHGVRRPRKDLSLHDSYPATCFPTAAALACSWDAPLMEQVGRTLATEAAYYGVAVLLGPGLNLKRHAAGGRNFEYWSEDPYLTGRLAAAYVRGVQTPNEVDGSTVAACPKHFAVNNQEDHRFVIDAVVDERTARELYLRAFHHVVTTAQPATLMTAYNRVNGAFCSESLPLCRRILRDEWRYDGVVVTDWGATNDRVAGVRATVDLEMPGSHGVHHAALQQALHDVALEESDLQAAAHRVARLIAQHQPPDDEKNEPSDNLRTNSSFHSFRSSASGGSCDKDYRPPAHAPVVDWNAHHAMAKATAMECAILLQNQDSILPLSPNTSIALIGDFAREHPRYQGMGSSQVSTTAVKSAYDEALRYTTPDKIHFAVGYHYDDDHVQDVDDQALREAVTVAQQADVAILFIGLPECMESEGFDRPHLRLPAQHMVLVTEICKVHNRVVVVLSNGGAVEMPWADQVGAILEGYLLGESGGAALVDLIFGAASPCGKLAETFPLQQTDILADRYFPGTQHRVEYREGLNVGYRFFDTARVPVRFPFGHGLTYTTFEYTNLDVTIVTPESATEAQSFSSALQINVTLQLTNTGSFAAKEIVQCYVHAQQSLVYRPEQELAAFTKVFLEPGQSCQVDLDLTAEAFQFYDVGHGRWVVEEGLYEVRVGSSCADIRLRESVQLDSGENASALAMKSYPPCKADDLTANVSDEVFFARFVTEFGSYENVCLANPPPIFPFHRNTLLKDFSEHRYFGKFLAWIVYLGASADVKPGPGQARQKRLARVVTLNLPLRTLVLFSHGGMSFLLLDAILALMNYQLLLAARTFCHALNPFRKRY